MYGTALPSGSALAYGSLLFGILFAGLLGLGLGIWHEHDAPNQADGLPLAVSAAAMAAYAMAWFVVALIVSLVRSSRTSNQQS